MLFVICLCASCAFADNINIHITDFGINQFWDSLMKIGNDFHSSSNPKESHNQVHSSMHEFYSEALGDSAKSQILIPMFDDSTMKSSSANLEQMVYDDLKKSVQHAIDTGNRDFEFQLVQNINTAGYVSPKRQKMVSNFTNAAYGAIARLSQELNEVHTVNLDATLGSNGTVGFARAVDQLKSVSGLFTMLDFVDGRASYEEMDNVIDIFGAKKIHVSNIQGDYWGHSPKMRFSVDKASISNHNTVKRLLRDNPDIGYSWLQPLSKDVGSPHVLRMTQPDAEFNVRRFYVDEKGKIQHYDVQKPMTSRDIRQLWGAADQFSQIGQTKSSLVIADRLRQKDVANRTARSIASMIPRNSRVVLVNNGTANQQMQFWIKAKVGPQNLYTLGRHKSETGLFKKLNSIDAEIVISFEQDAPRACLPNKVIYAFAKETYVYMSSATEQLAKVVDKLELTTKGEHENLKTLGHVLDVKNLLDAYDRDKQANINGPLAMMSSDTVYEFTKLFAGKTFESAIKAGKFNIPAYDSIKDAAFVITDVVREGRTIKTRDLQDLAKSAVGGLSYGLGLSVSGNVAVAEAFEVIGLGTANLVDDLSIKFGRHLAISNKEYVENAKSLVQSWENGQVHRLRNGLEVQNIEDYFERDVLIAAGYSSRDLGNMRNSIISKQFGLTGQLKEYSQRKFRDVNGFETYVRKIVCQTPGNDGSYTRTTRTYTTSHQSFNGHQENLRIQNTLRSETVQAYNSKGEITGGVNMDMNISNPQEQIMKDKTGRLKGIQNNILNSRQG